MTTSRPSHFKLTLGAVIAGTLVAPGALAQQGRLLEEIVVTAKKRAENIQDVPIAISAFSGDTLNEVGISRAGQLGEYVPGLEVTAPAGEGSQLLVFLRGAGLADFTANNAGPIGFYADDVFISSPILTSFQFLDLERVEVLKGPQGTLYGRNTTGGAIKFISNKPTEEFEASFMGSYGNYGTSQLEASISGPLTDSVRARAAISKNQSDGWMVNLVTGGHENGIDVLSWRTIVDADLGDRATVRLNLHGAETDQPTSKYNHVGLLPGGTDALGYAGPDDLYAGEYNRNDQKIQTDAVGGSVTFDVDFDSFTFTSVTAYDEMEHSIDEETDASPLDMLFVGSDVESETFSQELRLAGTTETIKWLAGVYYLDEDYEQNAYFDLFRTLRAFTGGVSDPEGSIFGAPILLGLSDSKQTVETYAVFGQADIDITDKLTATLGLRYTEEERTFDTVGTLSDEVLFGPDGLQVYSYTGLDFSDEQFSWRVGLDYTTDSEALLYASVSRGFKSGGFNAAFLSFDPAESAIQAQPYDSEFTTAYELGYKAELADGRLRLNAALFYNDFEDLQVFTFTNTGSLPVSVLDNASAADVMGLELDAIWYPTDSLLVNVSAAFMDSELKDFEAGGGEDLSGNSIAYTPETSITALVRYDQSLGDMGSAFVQGTAAYKSSFFFTPDNSSLLEQEAYTLVSARIGYAPRSEQWSLSLFGNNLTDEEYVTFAVDLADFGLVSQFVGVPRTYGIELRINL
jgi:iron complex outermembrane receptor protein